VNQRGAVSGQRKSLVPDYNVDASPATRHEYIESVGTKVLFSTVVQLMAAAIVGAIAVD